MTKREKDLTQQYNELEQELSESIPSRDRYDSSIEEDRQVPTYGSDEDILPADWDNISQQQCSQCGARLKVDEYQEFEDVCGECVYDNTSGLIDDNIEQEL